MINIPSSLSSENDSNRNSSSSTDTTDSAVSSGWKIEYKTVSESEPKGVWDGYQTREEFLMMHLR